MEARPPVSLDGWSEDDRTPEVLDNESERDPRLTPAARRRLALGGLGAIVAVAAVVGGLQVKDRRNAAAEERRLAGLLQLSASGSWPSFVEADLPSIELVDVYLRIPVRNDGPREVTVTRARWVRPLPPCPAPGADDE